MKKFYQSPEVYTEKVETYNIIATSNYEIGSGTVDGPEVKEKGTQWSEE